jgi:hypothetical protein
MSYFNDNINNQQVIRIKPGKIVALGAAGLFAVAASATVGWAVNTNKLPEPGDNHNVDYQTITEQLVERGVIPWQSLQQPTPSDKAILQNLVERAVIPSQTLEPADGEAAS